MKAKIVYIPVLSGAIIFCSLLVMPIQLYTDIADQPDCPSYQFAGDFISAKDGFLAAVVPCFICLFSIFESPLYPLAVSTVSAGTRDPPVPATTL